MTTTSNPTNLAGRATAGRVVALLLVAAAGLLLVQLRAHRGEDRLRVPDGARA
ncbi:MAG: hypothetical protein HZB46_02110, partial [Solirubrobacterales bacterium]|nr:hypothetical protein [Solirubrobacterales bacterium]